MYRLTDLGLVTISTTRQWLDDETDWCDLHQDCHEGGSCQDFILVLNGEGGNEGT